MVIGTPGSGKSYSIYGPFIRQMIQKGYAMFVYDYKFPDLTTRVMNELLDNYDCYKGVKPKMYVVNFDNPLKILAHMKNTGVNSLAESNWGIKEVREFCGNYLEKFPNLSLTYSPITVLAKRK